MLIWSEKNNVNKTNRIESKKLILYTVDKIVLLYSILFLFSANKVTTPVVAEPVLMLVIIALRFSNWLKMAKAPGPANTASILTIAKFTPDLRKTVVNPVSIPDIRLLLPFIQLLIDKSPLLT